MQHETGVGSRVTGRSKRFLAALALVGAVGAVGAVVGAATTLDAA